MSMSIWKLMTSVGWIASALIFLWMIFDAIKVGNEYSEEFLTSSKEGE